MTPCQNTAIDQGESVFYRDKILSPSIGCLMPSGQPETRGYMSNTKWTQQVILHNNNNYRRGSHEYKKEREWGRRRDERGVGMSQTQCLRVWNSLLVLFPCAWRVLGNCGQLRE